MKVWCLHKIGVRPMRSSVVSSDVLRWLLGAGEIDGIPHIGFISPLHRHICKQHCRKAQELYYQMSKQQPGEAQSVQERSAPKSFTRRLFGMLWADLDSVLACKHVR